MLRHVLVACCACLLLWIPSPRDASAGEVGKFLLPLDGKVLGVRSGDFDGNGRKDLVLLVETTQDEVQQLALWIVPTPATPVKRTGFAPDTIRRIPLVGPLARCGAVAVGRFGPKGQARIRLLGPEGIFEIDGAGAVRPPSGPRARPTLLGRSADAGVVFWDQHGDVDGDGRDELWFPQADGQGAVEVLGGTPATSCVLALEAGNRATRSDESLLIRAAYIPRLSLADLDGDGRRELVALEDTTLLAWRPTASEGPVPQSVRLALPFLVPDPKLPANELRTPRLQLEDVDGDGITDLLVTLIWGRTDRLGTLRTSLFHYPGPLVRKDGTLPKSLMRIDTESVSLHPRFIDLDGDGRRDYVGDSIRGNLFDLIRRLQGEDPKVTFVGYRFDGESGSYRKTPAFQFELGYSSEQALSNTFSQSAWFEGDFDGDGHRDLLDLGNLSAVQVLRGETDAQGRTRFEAPIVAPLKTPDTLAPDTHLRDLDGNGLSDAILWTQKALLWIHPRKGGR